VLSQAEVFPMAPTLSLVDMDASEPDAALSAGPSDDTLIVQPPAAAGQRGVIRFSPRYVAYLAREHRYPEWVLCAQIELLVRARHDEWLGQSIQPAPAADQGQRRYAA
jgi:hypothetical protein